jgi:polyhydroxybutyrate depolymerase
MVQRLACEASDAFAGFAAVVANMPAGLSGKCRPARQAPFLFIYGTDDPIMPPGGGDIRAGRRQGAGGRVISAADTVEFWANVHGCSGESDQEMPDRVDDGTSVRVRSFQGCGSPVLVYEVKGGGHSWPGGAAPRRAMMRRLIGNTSQEINATAAIVSFFKQFGL